MSTIKFFETEDHAELTIYFKHSEEDVWVSGWDAIKLYKQLEGLI